MTKTSKPKAPKPITAEEFYDRSVIAKRAAALFALRWDLRPGESCRLDIPTRYRTFRTPRGTRIKITGDHRYPVAKYWPGGELPPLVEAVAEYVWCQEPAPPPPERAAYVRASRPGGGGHLRVVHASD